jgi:RNA polymerase sigma-70 factor (ECF subfamily)
MARPVDTPGTGDTARFEWLYAMHYEDILAYALRRTASRDDALDVVAETFVTAWRRRGQLADVSGARLWLYGIARRVLANHLRGARRYERLEALLRARARGSLDDPHADDLAPIVGAWRRLRPEDREILTLVAAEGLSATEAARVWGCSAVAARVRLHRARTRFARELAAAGVDTVTTSRRRT